MGYMEQIKQLIKETWGRVDIEEILTRALTIEPTMSRARLTSIAHRMRRAGELTEDQAYRQRVSTRRWTEADLQELKRLAGTMPLEKLAEHFETTELAVRKRASMLQLSLAYLRSTPTRLSEDEINFATVVRAEAAQYGMSENRMAHALKVAAKRMT